MSNKHYVQSYYDGTLFEYSKEPKEGYREFINSAGTKSYRKYYNKGVDGVLKEISLRTNQNLHNREELSFTLESEGDTYYINFPVMSNQGDAVDDFVEAIVRALPSLEKGKIYNINNWRMNKGDVINGEEVKYTNQGVTFKDSNGVKIEPTLSYVTDNNPKGNIPRVSWKETAGKMRPSAADKERKLEYLYDVLKQQVERLGNNTESKQKEESLAPNKEKSSKSFIPENDNSDLPF